MIEYIKIIKHKYLTDLPIELNLSTKFKYSFDAKSKILSRAKLDFFENFWKAPNLTGIHGIVGQNGSGKTSIIREIFDWFRNGDCPNFESFVCVLKDHNQFSQFSIRVYQRCFDSIVIDQDWGTSIGIENNKRIDIDLELKMNIFPIFYSTGFGSDGLKFFYNYDEKGNSEHYIQDISSEFLLRNDVQHFQDNSISKPGNSTPSGFDNMLHVHQVEEMRRQIEFVIQFVANGKDSTIVKDIKSQIPTTVKINLNISKPTKHWQDFVDSIGFETNNFKDYCNELDAQEKHLETMVLSHLGTYAKLSIEIKPSVPYTSLFKDYWDTRSEFSVINFLGFLIGKEHEENRNPIFLTSLLELYNIHVLKKNNFVLNIVGTSPDHRNFVNHYLSLLNETSLIEFSHITWVYPMSSGQHALVNLFARIYYAQKKIGSAKNSVIFLDEVELYLHPEWQRKTIYWIENLISEVMKCIQCQVIIASHSPFILSDLPAECVSYIGKDAGTRYGSKCFAENIHSLFNKTFAMEEGLIGESARQKLNNLLMKMIKHGVKLKASHKVATTLDIREVKTRDLFLESIIEKKGEFGFILSNLADGPLKTILLRERATLINISKQ